MKCVKPFVVVAAIMVAVVPTAKAQGVVSPDTEPSTRDMGGKEKPSAIEGSATITSRSTSTRPSETTEPGAPGSTGPDDGNPGGAPGPRKP